MRPLFVNSGTQKSGGLATLLRWHFAFVFVGEIIDENYNRFHVTIDNDTLSKTVSKNYSSLSKF